MDDETRDEETTENNDDTHEEETKDETMGEGYHDDIVLEMMRDFKDELSEIRDELSNAKSAIAAFVDNGAIIRESDDSNDVDDFADDFVEIEDMDLSLDERR